MTERKIIAIDPGLCTGCRACEAICTLYHEKKENPRLSRIRVIKWGAFGVNIPVTCMHCDDPFCEKVCPTGARMRDPKTGAMITNEDLCIGCRSCLYACPWGAPIYNPDKKKSVTCDLCGGEPQCVKVCTPWTHIGAAALVYVTPTEEYFAKMRRFSSKVLEELKPGVR